MPSNVEVKAEVKDLHTLLDTAKRLSGADGTQMNQEDTFFNAKNGRLKLRIEEGATTGKLIFYKRNDISGPKQSDYMYTIVPNPSDLKLTLSNALGVRGCVRKVRQLFIVGQTRIHIDSVEGLGDYMELEVCMNNGQLISEGEAIAHDLMMKLGISNEDLITCAYMDLLEQKK